MRPRFLPRPPNMRRVVVVVPSLFTLFNLFFGIWSMVLASRGEFYRASWYIVFAGILDTLDGRVARLSNTGTRFGAELDSLVDIVSFGVAPAFLMYQLEFAGAGQASWIFCYFYVMAAAIRLARFNITQAGRTKSHFVGLPSPAAGMTLATYYPFTLTPFYRIALGAWPWHLILTFLMILLTILMVSNVRYATVPKIGFRTVKGFVGLLVCCGPRCWASWKAKTRARKPISRGRSSSPTWSAWPRPTAPAARVSRRARPRTRRTKRERVPRGGARHAAGHAARPAGSGGGARPAGARLR